MLESIRQLSLAVSTMHQETPPQPELPLIELPQANGLYGELEAQWHRYVTALRAFKSACEVVQEAIEQRNQNEALRQLDEVHQAAEQLFALLVSGSLQELAAHFAKREQMLKAKFEAGFCEAANLGQFSIDINDNRIVDADAEFLRFIGLPAGGVIGAPVVTVFPADEWARMLDVANAPSDSGKKGSLTVRANGYDGKRVMLKVVANATDSDNGRMLHGFAVDWSRTESDIQQRRLLAAAIDVSDRMVLITDRNQHIVFANQAFTHLSGYTLEEVKGKTPRILQGPDTDKKTRKQIRDALLRGDRVHAEVLNYSKEGLRYWVDLSIVPVRDDHDEITHYVSVGHDSTDRKAQELQITKLALFDHLTSLANRRAGEERLQLEWKRAARQDGQFAIALVDVDFFKRINDNYGHAVGDEALKHIAKLIRSVLRGGDWAARWGGEEFLVCFSLTEEDQARPAAERLRRAIERSVLMADGKELNLTVSIGLVAFSDRFEQLDGMIEAADTLLYKAKDRGRNRVEG